MSKQLFFEGFPIPRQKEAYTAPKAATEADYPQRLWQPIEQAISLNPDYFTLFNDLSGISKRKKMLSGMVPPTVNRIIDTGTLSRSAASRMKKAINYLSLISKPKKVKNVQKNYEFTFKTNFITLTLSDKQKHTDNFIKTKLLKNFIDSLRKRYPAISYVWKAETQNNGNIHFHIITDHFIPTSYINNRWNKIQYNYGYMDKYLSKKGTLHAPSCEVKKVKSDKDLQKYMRKYLLKGLGKKTTAEINAEIDSIKNKLAFVSDYFKREELTKKLMTLYRSLKEASKRPIKGKIWGCSDNLGLKSYTTHVNSLSHEDRELLFSNEILHESQYFTVFKLSNFRKFISEFSSYSKSFIISHYAKLIHPIKIPDLIYSTESNYRYS